jgi:hypothetical protein
MRRHDYTVEILGGATGANYALNYQEFQGIKLPTARRIFAYDEQHQKVAEPVLVSIDVAQAKFGHSIDLQSQSPVSAIGTVRNAA